MCERTVWWVNARKRNKSQYIVVSWTGWLMSVLPMVHSFTVMMMMMMMISASSASRCMDERCRYYQPLARPVHILFTDPLSPSAQHTRLKTTLDKVFLKSFIDVNYGSPKAGLHERTSLPAWVRGIAIGMSVCLSVRP